MTHTLGSYRVWFPHGLWAGFTVALIGCTSSTTEPSTAEPSTAEAPAAKPRAEAPVLPPQTEPTRIQPPTSEPSVAAEPVDAGEAPQESAPPVTTDATPSAEAARKLPKVARRPPGGRAQDAPAEDKLPEPPRPLAMPHVALSTSHQATCKVLVGDTFPAVTLQAADGAPKPFAELLGSRLTVVLFWDHANPYSVGELGDLQRDVFESYAEAGLTVVAIHVGDDAAAADSAATERGVSFPRFLDGDKSIFAQVATAKLPRTYLLNAAGEVLWFDIEYSRTTHRELLEAVEFTLAQAP